MAKSIPLLDEHCLAFLRWAPFAVLGFVDADGNQRALTVGGAVGELTTPTPHLVRLGAVDEEIRRQGGHDGASAGLCVLVPGSGETLRVNGRLRLDDDGGALVVEEAFLHCAKCVLRSRLWDDGQSPDLEQVDASGALGKPGVEEFLAESTFAFLVTTDAEGGTDVSPKGDPSGFVMVVDEHTLAIPDRPGNRRTDTFHNIIDNPQIGLLALVPGDARTLRVTGRARLSTDPAVLEPMAVKGHVPIVALMVEVVDLELGVERGPGPGPLWDASLQVEPGTLPKAGQVWKDHVAFGAGRAAATAMSLVPGRVLDAGLKKDYSSGLY